MREIPKLKTILIGTELEKSAACLQKMLDTLKITNLTELQDSARIFGGREICGHSPWLVIRIVNEQTLSPPLPETEKPAAKKKAAAKKSNADTVSSKETVVAALKPSKKPVEKAEDKE